MRALTAAFEARHYRVSVARSGKEALERAAAENPAVVILDLGLPDIDGVEVCRRIRAWSTVPIIVLTAEWSDASKVQALDEGADDYVTKPFSMPELQARLRVALRHRRVGTKAIPSRHASSSGNWWSTARSTRCGSADRAHRADPEGVLVPRVPGPPPRPGAHAAQHPAAGVGTGVRHRDPVPPGVRQPDPQEAGAAWPRPVSSPSPASATASSTSRQTRRNSSRLPLPIASSLTTAPGRRSASSHHGRDPGTRRRPASGGARRCPGATRRGWR